MTDSGGKEFGLPEGIPPGKRITVETKGHITNEKKLKQVNKKLRKAVPLVAAASLTTGAVAGEALQPIHKTINKVQEFLGTNDIKTYPYQEIGGLNDFKKSVENQLSVGNQVNVEDLVIAVPEGGNSLKIRYFAKTLPSEEGMPSGIAVEIPAGKMLEVKNAAIVFGEQVDPNDPSSHYWYAVNLKQFGLDGYGYISKSSFTSSVITPENNESVTISQTAENGSLHFSKNGQDQVIGKVVMK